MTVIINSTKINFWNKLGDKTLSIIEHFIQYKSKSWEDIYFAALVETVNAVKSRHWCFFNNQSTTTFPPTSTRGLQTVDILIKK